MEPKALLLDEPLSALDASTRRRAARELGGDDPPGCLGPGRARDPRLRGGRHPCRARSAWSTGGRIIQRGSATELAAARGIGICRGPRRLDRAEGPRRPSRQRRHADPPRERRMRESDSADPCELGDVSVSVHPWEILIEPPGCRIPPAPPAIASRLESLRLRDSATAFAVGLDAGQPLVCRGDAAGGRGARPGAGGGNPGRLESFGDQGCRGGGAG